MKYSTKRILLVCGLSLLANTAWANIHHVNVTSIVDHPALNAVKDGLKEGLEKAGFREGENLEFKYQTAQGNQGIASQIARQFVGELPDAIVAISTPSAQAVVAINREIPTFYAAVTDPVAAKLVSQPEGPSGKNVSGISDQLDLDVQYEFIKEMVPNARRVGIIYNPGEVNSMIAIQKLKKLFKGHDLELIEATASRSVDVSQAARSLVSNVDVIYVTTDNLVVSTIESIIQVCNKAHIPLIASDPGSVERGALAALGVSYKEQGEILATMVAQVLNGKDIAQIPVRKPEQYAVYINEKTVEQINFSVPESVLKRVVK